MKIDVLDVNKVEKKSARDNEELSILPPGYIEKQTENIADVICLVYCNLKCLKTVYISAEFSKNIINVTL